MENQGYLKSEEICRWRVIAAFTVHARFVFELPYHRFAVPNIISFGRKLFPPPPSNFL
jgi:hypothetical protein